jgi:secreted trypsin-like serine protease
MATTGETIHLRASICPGDSGGPVLGRGGTEVVGVISMSAMDGDDRTTGPSVMARIDAYRSVLAHARLVADGSSLSELPPLSCLP